MPAAIGKQPSAKAQGQMLKARTARLLTAFATINHHWQIRRDDSQSAAAGLSRARQKHFVLDGEAVVRHPRFQCSALSPAR
jgi:hypothetical protein